jgi:hypothetical protein
MAPFSQRLEPPQNPGRFKPGQRGIVSNIRKYSSLTRFFVAFAWALTAEEYQDGRVA